MVVKVESPYSEKEISLRQEYQDLYKQVLPLLEADANEIKRRSIEFEESFKENSTFFLNNILASQQALRKSVEYGLSAFEQFKPDDSFFIEKLQTAANIYDVDRRIR